ncbi:MAG: TRAP transporter large permease [Spirochaetales bacterium]|nr:TRAP transporter large permease [Spirochaetales bacterium]
MSPELIGLLGVLALLVLIMFKFPIGSSMLLIGIVGYGIVIGPTAALAKMGTDIFNNAHSYSMSVIPMFTLMGMFIGSAGIGQDMFKAFNAWFGHIKGGLAIASIVTCAAFAAVSGSVIATTATIAVIAVPEMRRMKYDDSLAAGSVASGSTLGILIPPSSVLIIYGVLTEESIGQLLIAGIIPGLITAVFLAFTAYLMVRLKPELAPGAPKTPMKERLTSLKPIWPVPAIFLFTMGGIYMGVFTPTEGGAMGAFLALVFALLSRRMNMKAFLSALYDTIKVGGMLMIIVIGGVIFGNFISVTRIPAFLAVHMADMPPFLLLATIFGAYFVSGFFMDAMATLVIYTSLFYPLIIKAGYNGIWYGIITILMILIGFLTPPVGVVSVVTSGITKIKLETVFKGTIPFWFALIASTVLLMLFPDIATFLPNFMDI